MAARDIVVIGASLGGIGALKVLAAALPKDLPAALFVVLHLAPSSPGVLPSILQRAGPLTASNAQDGEPIRPGHIFVAPPDRHLLVDARGLVRTSRGPKENLSRPAVDPLFRSAAAAFGRRTIGVILTGALDDGAAGLWSVKQQGGTALVQHPNDAVAPSMPLNAMLRTAVDHCVPLAELASLLARLVHEPVRLDEPFPVSDRLAIESRIAAGENVGTPEMNSLGHPSQFACPECHGVLSEIDEGGHARLRCHTGHAYSFDSLLAELHGNTEKSLWNALRAVEEKAMLFRRMAAELKSRDRASSAECERKAAEMEAQAEALRKMIMGEGA